MKRPASLRSAARQHGVAAIELALCLAACVLLAPTVLSVSSVFLYYAAMHKAVHEGARYMAALPPQALNTEAAASQSMAAARALVTATAQQAGVQLTLPADRIVILCGNVACYGTLPSTVTVSAAISVPLPTELFSTDSSGAVQVESVHTMRYVYSGN